MTTNRKKNGYYKRLQFNNLNKSSEMVLSQGMIVLDNAIISNCDIGEVNIQISYVEDNNVVSVTKNLKDYHYIKNSNGYKVDFLKNISVSCWINITQPTRIKITAAEICYGIVDLEFFVIKIH